MRACLSIAILMISQSSLSIGLHFKMWTKEETLTLRILLRDKNLLATEIAEKLGRSPGSVRFQMRLIGISAHERLQQSGRYPGRMNAKHKHLRKAVMRFFHKHTWEETRKKFSLTASEMKSLMTCSYRIDDLRQFRKDHRRKDSWTSAELRFLLQEAGLQRRKWIAKKINRGNGQGIKTKFKEIGISSRYVNGLPKTMAEMLLCKPINYSIKVKAGPNIPFKPNLVPWVVLYSEAKKAKARDDIIIACRAMSKFQKRVHGTRGVKDTLMAIETILGEKYDKRFDAN